MKKLHIAIWECLQSFAADRKAVARKGGSFFLADLSIKLYLDNLCGSNLEPD